MFLIFYVPFLTCTQCTEIYKNVNAWLCSILLSTNMYRFFNKLQNNFSSRISMISRAQSNCNFTILYQWEVTNELECGLSLSEIVLFIQQLAMRWRNNHEILVIIKTYLQWHVKNLCNYHSYLLITGAYTHAFLITLL